MTAQEVLTTGIAGLDALLGGGVTPGSLVFVVGSPGAGKTILGCQVIFSAARAGRSAAILSAYSEGHEKLLQHLASLDFFDRSLIGGRIRLLSLQQIFGDNPASAAVTLVRVIRETGAEIVLIDGFQGLVPLSSNPDIIRQLLSALAAQLAYTGTTVIVTLAGDARDPGLSPVLTAVDVALGLVYRVQNLRHERLIEVVKQRGRAQIAGLHPFVIANNGLTVLPRIESHPLPAVRPRPEGRATFGLAELDAQLGGGLPAGTTTILAGGQGSGKTTLALHWALQDARPDAVSVIVTFRETPEQLAAKAEAFGLPLRAAQELGAVRIVRIPPVELLPDLVSTQILSLFRELSVRRLVIEDLGFLLRALGDRGPNYCAALVEHFYGEGVTTLCTLETDPLAGLQISLAGDAAEVLADNLLVVQQEMTNLVIRRVLAVVQMRASAYDPSLCSLEIDSLGIRVRKLSL